MAQLVERPVRHAADVGLTPPGVAKDCPPGVSFQCCLLPIFIQPAAMAFINISAHVEEPKHWQPYRCSWQLKMCPPPPHPTPMFYRHGNMDEEEAAKVMREDPGCVRCLFVLLRTVKLSANVS